MRVHVCVWYVGSDGLRGRPSLLPTAPRRAYTQRAKQSCRTATDSQLPRYVNAKEVGYRAVANTPEVVPYAYTPTTHSPPGSMRVTCVTEAPDARSTSKQRTA